MEKTSLAGIWRLTNGAYETEGRIPGDVADDLIRAGKIRDPYVGYNYRDSLWVQEMDWAYERTFEADEKMLQKRNELCLEGVDTFARVLVNGQPVGETDSMFLEYRFPLDGRLRLGQNLVRIELKSSLKALGSQPQTRYDSVFCANRIFLRKAQCHFGWDWAPKFPGYGVYREVSVLSKDEIEFDNVRVDARTDGTVSFFAEFENRIQGRLSVRVYEKGRLAAEAEVGVNARRKLVNVRLKDPRLWWPNGYGEAFLYDYELQAEAGGKTAVCRGSFGIRKIELEQTVLDAERLSFAFRVNGRRVFARGSNWVPAECMTGRLTESRYEKLIELAGQAGINMLRVWGGGIYESEAFYRACDRAGIMIWQDFMFACQEIPDDDEKFLAAIEREAAWQIKRLRNHPCIVYWCGMNEGRGSFQPGEPRFGRRVFAAIRGLVSELDGTRPFSKMSPVGFSDIQNDDFVGDSHNNCTEICLFREGFKGFEECAPSDDPAEDRAERIRNYTLFLEETPSNFTSECAVLGACNYESLVKFIPAENLRLGDPIFEDRFLGNPYTYVMPSFYERQSVISAALFGAAKELKDFVKKCGRAQLDILESEIVYARCNGRTQGFLNWMYNDIWPTGTWSVVDYYLSLKPAYYAMKRRFRPLMCAFQRLRAGWSFHAVNNSDRLAEGNLELSLCTYSGCELLRTELELRLEPDGRFERALGFEVAKGDYLCCTGRLGEEEICEVYDLKKYRAPVYNPLFKVIETKREKTIGLELRGERFAPCLRIEAVDAEGRTVQAEISDNFFDLAPGTVRHVTVRCGGDAEIRITPFTEVWER